MTDIPLWLQKIRELEAALRRSRGASGSGLGELEADLSRDLPPDVIRELHDIRRMRNRVIHDHEVSSIPSDFVARCDHVIAALRGAGRDAQRDDDVRADDHDWNEELDVWQSHREAYSDYG